MIETIHFSIGHTIETIYKKANNSGNTFSIRVSPMYFFRCSISPIHKKMGPKVAYVQFH